METVLAADEAPAPGPSPIMLELRYTFENDPVFEPAKDPYRVAPEMVEAFTVFAPRI
jgi:hypothetical protein